MKFFLNLTLCFFLLPPLSLHAQNLNQFYQTIVGDISASNISQDLNTLVDFGIKEPGTLAIGNAKEWIVSRYQDLGYTDIDEQAFSVFGQITSNIIITKTGSVYPNTFVIIDGHYDTLNGPGANDNGSGTVIILELARLLKDVDTEYYIKFIHFSGEEEGLLGSEYYVNHTLIPENLDIKLVLNIDEVGGVAGANNNTIVCERDEHSNPSSNNANSALATQILANCFGLYSDLQTEISYAYASDYVPFENNGEVITGLYEKNESPYPHTPFDTIENIDVDYVYEVAKGALGAALHFAVGRESLLVSGNSFNEDISVYPNPSNGQITIHFNLTSEESIALQVFDILGKMVYSTSLKNENNILDLEFLQIGVYEMVFKSPQGTLNKKLILE